MSSYGSGNSWQICRRSCCFDDCTFVHKYKYCYNYQNTICSREEMCPYIHITSVEQARYEATGKATEYLKQEVGRTLQNPNICKDFKNDNCNRDNCNLRHVNSNRSLECPICCEEVKRDTFGT
ncbi:uncharacterized protein LOC112461518, partial [Temnothorax curvispinosus]|uniref:Uncharacterized protein LOC112461518 n=1 Tax=Temnothorax curvispinosus TaxID=300111 RepID=A0A6J1QJF1_9HYME